MIGNHEVVVGTILFELSADDINYYIVVNAQMRNVYVIKYIAEYYSNVAYVQQFRALCAEIQHRIRFVMDFTNLPPIYNIADDLTNYQVTGIVFAGGKRRYTKRNQKESVGKRTLKTKPKRTLKPKRILKPKRTLKTKRTLKPKPNRNSNHDIKTNIKTKRKSNK